VTSRRRNWYPLADFRILIRTVPILDYFRIANRKLTEWLFQFHSATFQ
jgi:hypothetical protein